MSESKLAVNWIYLAFVTISAFGALGFCAWSATDEAYQAQTGCLAACRGFGWPVAICIDLVCATSLAALRWKIYSDSRTVIGEEALTQPGILGARVIRWKDVTEVRLVGFYCHVVSGKKKIVLAPYAYRNPESIVTMVLSRVADRDNLH